jgi:hypothetical protein
MLPDANRPNESSMNRQPLYGSLLLALYFLLRQEFLEPRAPAFSGDGSPSRQR